MQLDHLNPPQRAAVKYLDGPCLVLAGAGSGKTRVITQKIAYLIQAAQMDARNIAAITFTNKAAREMQERVGSLLPPDRLRGLTVSTFHSLGMRILREEARHLATSRSFRFWTAEISGRSSAIFWAPPTNNWCAPPSRAFRCLKAIGCRRTRPCWARIPKAKCICQAVPRLSRHAAGISGGRF